MSYVIAILGCADGAADCRPVATMPVRYESQAACHAATGGVLAANSEFDFPTIVAQCRAAKPQPASARQPAKRDLPVSARQS